MAEIVLNSTLKCPKCGFEKDEQMPTDCCQFFYQCCACREVFKPLAGDCCVYCSYGTVKCPPMQKDNGCCS